VDLRRGPSWGTTFSLEITPAKAVFVPRGVANGYQTLEERVTYTYLVNAHWSPDASYPSVHPFDPDLGIDWPIAPDAAIISDKDAAQPRLADLD
jgi:dTDP-4-dehydrorhamnose 3,5-epimerase-like enzyme